MENAPHIIETALLLLIAFLIGCLIGWFLRSKLFGDKGKSPVASMTGNTAATSSPVDRPVSAQSYAPVEKAASVSTSVNVNTTETKQNTAPKTLPDTKTPVKNSNGKTTAAKSSATKKPAKKASVAKKTTTKKAATQKTTSAKSANTGRPEGLSAPRGGTKDNLKLLNGVGPKIESILNELGIYHFDQIGSWKRASINWVDDYLSFKGRIDRDKWVAQAKKLAKDTAKNK